MNNEKKGYGKTTNNILIIFNLEGNRNGIYG